MVKPFFALQLLLLAGSAGLAAGRCSGQGRMVGFVPTAEASSTGVLAVSGDKSLLGEASVVKALDRPAHVTLARGDAVLVCQTSILHLTQAESILPNGGKLDLLLLSLDRGAFEISMPLTPGDLLITPDLRLSSASGGGKPAPLDLTLRVAPNGDTCVDNRGRKSPALEITDAFGESTYLLKPGQHVLFEHGSLKEVVDREQESCGCPPASAEGVSLAEAALRGGSAAPSSAPPAEPYPFPAAVSEGLAQPRPPGAERPGDSRVPLATTLTYDPSAPPAPTTPTAPTDPAMPAEDAPPAPTAPAAAAPTQPHPAQAPRQGIFHSVSRFFKRIFAR